MKNFIKLSIISLFAFLLFISCEKEDTIDKTTPPEITDLTAGTHDGSTTIKRGGEFGVDFNARVLNDGRLDKYHIEIHDHPTSGKVEDEYKIIDSTFTDIATFKGTKNSHVHQHITVPLEANLGKYHVVVVVFDEYGNTANTEDIDTEIEIIN